MTDVASLLTNHLTSRARRALTALTIVLVALSFGRSARASHYAIQDVPHLISAAEVDKLHKAGIDTTEQLLNHAATVKDRKTLAKSSGLGAPTLLGLARRCDLLRIKGIGSEMVLLLQAAGVQSSADLAKRDAAGLIAAVSSANQAKKISEKPPTEPQLQHWIEEAKQLPTILESK